MVRATNASARKARRKKLYNKAKGFRASRKNIYRVARNAVFKAGQHMYADRRRQRRTLRRLWIIRINAAAREHGLPYRSFMEGLSRAHVVLDRRALAELATSSPAAFQNLVALARQKLNGA